MKDKWKDRLIKIAQYLGANEGEFVVVVGKLCQEVIEEYKKTLKDAHNTFNGYRCTCGYDSPSMERDKYFEAQKHFQQALEEKIEKIKDMKYAEPMGDERQGGFNSACDDIINLLEEE